MLLQEITYTKTKRPYRRDIYTPRLPQPGGAGWRHARLSFFRARDAERYRDLVTERYERIFGDCDE